MTAVNEHTSLVTRGYPPAPRTGPVEVLHGIPVADPYRWLEDESDPETAAWSAAQEDLFAAHRSGWALLEPMRRRIAELVDTGSVSVPVARGGLLFNTVREPGRDQAALRVCDAGGHDARTLWDPLVHDPSGLTVLESWDPSQDGSLIAVQYSAAGTEDTRLVVLDVATGRPVDGPIERLRRSPLAWLPDSSGFYYVRRRPPEEIPGEERYHRRVRLHRLGTDPEGDALIFGEGRAMDDFYTPALSPDGRWLTIAVTRGADPATELWLADLGSGAPEAPVLRHVLGSGRARLDLVIPAGTGPHDRAYLITYQDAPNGRLESASPAALTGSGPESRSAVSDAPDPQLTDSIASSYPDSVPDSQPVDPPRADRSPSVLVPEDPEAVLTEVAALDGLLLLTRVRHGVCELTVHDPRTGDQLHRLALPGPGTVGSVRPAPDGREAWFGYTDHITPSRVMHFDARSAALTGWASAPGAPVIEGCVVRRIRYAAHDGTPVTAFVLSPSGRPDRPRPTVVSGYGGFGASIVPGWAAQALAWVEMGGVYVFTCLRGGGEEGQAWHDAGRRANKQATFDDLDAAADRLVAAGWADPARLGLLGSSNGGLTVAAALTQHPEKYAAVVSVAPLLDMVRYEHSGMGPSWREEYGTAADPADLAVLHAYSPYHHVRESVDYPAVLFGVADGDTRVDPLHARKMCAALQHASAAPAPILLRLERGVGHGARGTATTVDLFADVMTFLAEHLDLARDTA
ncbi:S9 family peptidase [Catenulispora sp. NL8]|uniref:prolyl oligopeptidase n=1 Tax=Catenulispora pinistramenti TaxID=2705254 RepID=A0ABS5L2P5_9ACTN|nr:prolyl oligopeptidase family serine peptidase [Catenulispora pinistramenti]MBS2552449.1 S9 family peptidase [Catenulispora pinistramenti]